MERRFIYFLNFFRVKVWLRTVAERKTEIEAQDDKDTERQRDREMKRQRDEETER